MTHPVKSPRKLIEVALPLDAINVAAAREKSIRHGHPSTLHLWWARRPLAAARAVICAQLVNDPGYQQGGGFKYGKNKKEAAIERKRLFKIIEDLVLWENTTNEEVLERARAEIRRSWREVCELNKDHLQAAELFNPEKLPALHDPFAGGGSIPLEAQRLGLEAYASDLNPVAVLINKAMIEIPPKFAGRAPVGPEIEDQKKGKKLALTQSWPGATGLAEDVRRYGAWMRAEAQKRIGHLYPPIEITTEMARERSDLQALVGQKLTVIAWLWARTVKSPNPAFSHVDVPLASTFMLSTKVGKEAYVEPVIEGGGYRFTVKVGKPKDVEMAKNGTSAGKRNAFLCLMSGAPMDYDYIRTEGKAGRMGARMMAIVAEGKHGRVYLSPTEAMEAITRQANPEWKPDNALPVNPRDFKTPNYGLTTFADLFTPRQLVALTTFSDLVQEARERVQRDALAAGFDSPTQPSPAGGGLSDSSPAGGGLSDSSPQRGEVGRGDLWRPTPVPQALLETARDLRKNMTDAEQLLWRCLRGKQLAGFKFRKQHPIERFVLDFYCASAKLAIELDGGQHNTDDGKARDAERNAYLEKQGIRVVRFWNHEVFEHLDGVLTRIWEALHEGLHFPHPAPSPLGFAPTQPSPAGGGLSGSSPWRGEVGRGDDISLRDGGTGATAYAEAVATYLAFAIDRMAMTGNSLVRWNGVGEKAQHCFGRQALPMLWDFAEPNFLATATGSVDAAVFYSYDPLNWMQPHASGWSKQEDAATQLSSRSKIISTDPPYYDNIGYADLSDFFYVWLRRALRPVFPDLFATLAVPKAEELVATPYRHGSKEKAETFFLDGMTQAMRRLAEQAHPAFPVTIYYAFKQSESDGDEGATNTGWDTFLAAVIEAGFAIGGTWPMRTEMKTRQIAMDTNALASSIVLVCRQRDPAAATVSRREFLRELNTVLPEALDEMTKGSSDARSPVAPVDLSQAIIGPGMAVFSKYTAVLEADGTPMSVRTALQLINRFLAEDDFDPDTQFCLHWFEQHGWGAGRFGDADTLSRAKGTSVDGMRDAGVTASGGGIVRLCKWSEYPTDWDPQTDTRNPVWETLHHLIRALKQEGETGAGRLLAAVKGKAEAARQLAYRLYTLCERQGWAEDARAYNELITSWTGIESAAGAAPTAEQGNLFA